MNSKPEAPWTVLRLLNWTKEYFAQAGLEEPRLAAEVLLAHALGLERIQLYAGFDHQPPPEQLASFRDMVQRARQHEPIAYLVGSKEFYSLKFKVTPDVLIPRPETEALVAEAVAHLKSLGRDGLVWDVCTGSGCVAIAVAKQVPAVRVLATDVCDAAVAIACENARTHGVQDRLRCRQADLLTLPADCDDLAAFDVITANPPYVAQGEKVAETVQHEPKLALYAGADGLDAIRPIVRDAPGLLRDGGSLILEFGYAQADAVRDLIVAGGRFEEPRILPDHQGIERTAVARRRE